VNQKLIGELENKGVLQLLIFLLQHGKTKVTDIHIDASSGTLYRALNTLAKLELIDEERIRPYTRYIQLTGDGEAIGKKLEEINTILEAKKGRQGRQARS
jgi:DNA-binding PadR family transcriptional regulator